MGRGLRDIVDGSDGVAASRPLGVLTNLAPCYPSLISDSPGRGTETYLQAWGLERGVRMDSNTYSLGELATMAERKDEPDEVIPGEDEVVPLADPEPEDEGDGEEEAEEEDQAD